MEDKVIQLAESLIQQDLGNTAYDYQHELITSEDPRVIINKSRQIGATYSLALKGLMHAYFDDESIMLCSASERQSRHVLEYGYKFLNLLRDDFDIKPIEETKMMIRFKYGGRMISVPNSPSTSRGYRVDRVFMDEIAHFLNGTDKEMYEAMLPSIIRGKQVILSSTPFGELGLFYDFWINAEKRGFQKMPHTRCPDFTPERIDIIKQSMDDLSFEQEMNCQFIGELTSYFTYALLQSCIDTEHDYWVF
jgi:phage FluMu gp28-like protein